MELQKAIQAFYQTIIDKDVQGIHESYIADEDTYVILEGPRLSTMGYKKIASGWIDFCDSAITLDDIKWIEGPFEEINGALEWLAGVIELSVTINDKSFKNTFRSSFVLKKSNGRWKIRHEHVSGALEDPYGIGDWLKKNNNSID